MTHRQNWFFYILSVMGMITGFCLYGFVETPLCRLIGLAVGTLLFFVSSVLGIGLWFDPKDFSLTDKDLRL